MTKQEHKLKTMLNYYEVNLTGGKDEKLNKTDLNKFIDKFIVSVFQFIMTISTFAQNFKFQKIIRDVNKRRKCM